MLIKEMKNVSPMKRRIIHRFIVAFLFIVPTLFAVNVMNKLFYGDNFPRTPIIVSAEGKMTNKMIVMDEHYFVVNGKNILVTKDTYDNTVVGKEVRLEHRGEMNFLDFLSILISFAILGFLLVFIVKTVLSILHVYLLWVDNKDNLY